MNALALLARGAATLSTRTDAAGQWAAIDEMLGQLYTHRLFTALLHLPEHGLMKRLYTSDENVSPLGGFKATGSGPWSSHVLGRGEIYVGSNATDIRTVFSEGDMLAARGLEAVLNIPVWHAGRVIGSLNLLNGEGAYDTASHDVAQVVAAMCVPCFIAAAEAVDVTGIDKAGLDKV